jgi:hypothetical protein
MSPIVNSRVQLETAGRRPASRGLNSVFDEKRLGMAADVATAAFVELTWMSSLLLLSTIRD